MQELLRLAILFKNVYEREGSWESLQRNTKKMEEEERHIEEE